MAADITDSPNRASVGLSPDRGIVRSRPRFTRSRERAKYAVCVEFEIRPEPPEAVRRAIAEALAATREQPVSPWWRAGLEDQDEPTAPPRSSDGAERA
jgi:hypothetical protein